MQKRILVEITRNFTLSTAEAKNDHTKGHFISTAEGQLTKGLKSLAATPALSVAHTGPSLNREGKGVMLSLAHTALSLAQMLPW